jgi:hypothetical protein
VVAVAGVLAGGCARRSVVIPVSVHPGPQSTLAPRASLRSYESAVPAIATILVTDFGLPLPPPLTVFVYPTQRAYVEGLAQIGRIRAERAAWIARHAVALAQRHALFINDEALRGACAGTWLGLIAHELTHAAQYELSGGRRGRSEQWLREGMADWVAARVLVRLGTPDESYRREHVLNDVRQAGLPAGKRFDLRELGRPLDWETQHLRVGGHVLYNVAFLLTADLVRLHGFQSMVAYFRSFATSDDRAGNFSRAFGVSLDAFAGETVERLSDDLERGENPEAPRSFEPPALRAPTPESTGGSGSPSCPSR